MGRQTRLSALGFYTRKRPEQFLNIGWNARF